MDAVVETMVVPTAKNKREVVIRLVCMVVLLAVLVVARAMSGFFFYVFVTVSLVIFTLCKVSHCIPLLLFLLPVASILKPSVDSMSFFTVLFFVTVIKLVIHQKRFTLNFVVITLLLGIYCFAFSGINQFSTILTMLAGLIMLYCIRAYR